MTTHSRFTVTSSMPAMLRVSSNRFLLFRTRSTNVMIGSVPNMCRVKGAMESWVAQAATLGTDPLWRWVLISASTRLPDYSVKPLTRGKFSIHRGTSWTLTKSQMLKFVDLGVILITEWCSSRIMTSVSQCK